jgi:quercetin dioxygenase-like cupin family protein/ketosteroid isomerase-like protein
VAESLQKFFEMLPSRVPAENLIGMKNSYLFDIKKVGSWLVAVDEGAMTVKEGDGEADLRIAMAEDVFRKLISGEQNAMRGVMTGKIRLKGNIAASSKLQKIFGGPDGEGDEAAAPAGADAGAATAKTREDLRRALGGRSGGDGTALLEELLAEDVVWHGAAGGDARGKPQVIERWAGGPRVEVGDDVYVDGIHAVVFADISSEGSSGSLRQAIVLHLDENGKITELWGVPSDTAIADALANGRPVPEHPVLAAFLGAQLARQRGEFDPADVAALEGFFQPDVTWHMGGRTGWAQDKKGLDQVVATFKALKQATGGTFAVEIHELFVDDAHAVGRSHLTADRPEHPDKHMDVEEVSLFHLRSGKVTEFWGIPLDEAERDAFWMDDRTPEDLLEEVKTALGLPALLTSKGTGGAISMLEVHLPPGALLAPVHTHFNQDEASYVLEGELCFYLGGEVTRHGAGEFAFKPKGIPHTIFNDSDTPASFIELCWPGGLDDYLEEMAVALSGGGPPDMDRISAIAAKYGIESYFDTIGELYESYGVHQIGM